MLTLTAEDLQRKKNDVKARTTLLLSLSDEHQLRFSKYKTVRELWAAILKTFGGNEATKKTKKNLLKHQYGNFKAEGLETLEQTFNRLQVIVGQLQFMDIEIKQDDLNQKFLTSLALEWLMHTIVWRNRSNLDTMSLDNLYNHLKIYESEVQKKPEQNSQNMAFISSVKHSSRNEDGNTTSVPTASTNVLTASASVATISQDTTCAYIASQSSDKFWKKTGKKISIQGSNITGFDKSKVECFNCHKMGHFDWSYMVNDEEDHALVSNEVAPTEFALMANTDAEKKNKEGLGYTVVPPPTAQLYLSSKKDLSWTSLPECANDIVTDYSRPSPTTERLCREFEALMHENFQMSAMGELNFFLGLQVLQKEDGIFLSQDKYIGDILKKFGFSDVRSSNTLIDKENPWGKDGPGKDVELHLYRSKIGSLMYLTASRPDIMFAVCACARHQVTPKECHLHAVKRIFRHQVTPKECHLYAVKRIFRYLKGHPKLGLWYPKESPFDLVSFSDSDYGGATQD
nr:hypothetical protein [Tanacetum cinerariifolium]